MMRLRHGEFENARRMNRESHFTAAETRDQPRLPILPVFTALYLLALATLSWRLGSHPGFAYNWEEYSLRGVIDFVNAPSSDVLKLHDGRMTASGNTAPVVGPAWLGFENFGQSLLGLRFPLAVIGAFAVPLAWLLGRTLYSDVIGIAAALLLITSPAFLLYARTGTVVGLSLTPALAGFLMLWMCVRPSERGWLPWLIGLQFCLILNSYVYGPIRFLWPIALALFAVELMLRGGQRQRFAISLIVTVAVLPLALTFLRPGPLESPVKAVEAYYTGRGEQIFTMRKTQDGLLRFLRAESEVERQRLAELSTNQQQRRLVQQNAGDLANLLIDRDTRPVVTDFWNPHGRLYPRILVPFFLAGMALLLFRFFADPRARLVLALFWGNSLPLVLTTQVHVGRLYFILPLLGLICALPVAVIARWLSRRQPPNLRAEFNRWAMPGLAAILVVAGAAPGLSDWQTDFPVRRMPLVADRIVEVTRNPPAQQLAYVFGDVGEYETESLRVAELEVLLDGYLRFEDMTTGDARGNGPIPLIYGGLIPLLGHPDVVPGYCTNLYLVEPNVADRFHEVADPIAAEACGAPLRVELLDL
jgi:hypothetical protein